MTDESENLYIITGDDAAAIAVTAEKVVDKLTGGDRNPFAVDVIRENDDTSVAETLHQVIRSVKSPSFLGGAKTVWLQNFEQFPAEGTQKSKTAEAIAFQELCAVIGDGLPPGINLVLSGPDCDQRKALFRTCKEHGRPVVCKKPDMRQQDWQEQVDKRIRAVCAEKDIKLTDTALNYFVDIIGADSARIEPELEKLLCYCGGPGSTVTLQDAQAVCTGDSEAAAWALQEPLGKRDQSEALRMIDKLVQQSRTPEKAARGLLTQTANFYRQLLQIRVLMQSLKVRDPQTLQRRVKSISAERKDTIREKGLDVISMHPYRLFKLAQLAVNYSGPELVKAIRLLRDAHWKCITSSTADRTILEQTVLQLIDSTA